MSGRYIKPPGGNRPVALPVSYATASADAILTLVTEHYGSVSSPTCRLLMRGFNDVYEVDAESGARFILRVSGHRARGPADVAAETAFLAHLDAQGVPVAVPVPARDGALFTAVPLPDGVRAAVLFRHADGRRPDLDDPDDARTQGIALAHVHRAAERVAGRKVGRYRLDLDHLLHRQVAAVLSLELDTGVRGHPSYLADGGVRRAHGEWGREILSAAWLEREVGFLLTWEHERLSPGLL